MISISHLLSLLMFPVHYLIDTWFLYLIFSPCWCFQSIISSIHVSISHFLSLLMFPVHYLIDTWFLYLIFSPCWCFQSIISSIHGFYISFSLLAVDPGMSLNCAPTRVCRKSASRPGYVVKVRPDPGMS